MDIEVLFLDIDGVLIPDKQPHPQLFAPQCVSQLLRILDARSQVQVVFSTTWRFGSTRLELLDNWRAHRLPQERILGDTPHLDHYQRGEEIRQWLDDAPLNHPDLQVRAYAVLDDEPALLGGLHQRAAFICHPWFGLTPDVADAVIAHFGQHEPP